MNKDALDVDKAQEIIGRGEEWRNDNAINLAKHWEAKGFLKGREDALRPVGDVEKALNELFDSKWRGQDLKKEIIALCARVEADAGRRERTKSGEMLELVQELLETSYYTNFPP